MRGFKKFCLPVLCLLLAPVSHGQKSLAIPGVVERAIKEKERDWTLTSVMITKNKEADYSYFRWQRGKQEIATHLNEYTETVQISPQSLLVAAPSKCTPIEGLGDEAYLLSITRYDRTSQFHLTFRKGNILVSIEADAADIAVRFAEHFAHALPPSRKAVRAITLLC